MSDQGRPKDLRLVKPAERIERAELDEATEALRAAVAPEPLADADHEAILAMTLGEDVSALGAEERADAEALRSALERGAPHPLAELCQALSALGAAERPTAALAEADHEALLAITLGAADHEARVAPSLVASEPVRFSEDDRAAAEALRGALEGRGAHPLGTLASALRAAAGRLGDLDELGHERILRRVLRTSQERARAGRMGVVAAIVTLAAAVALFVGSFRWLETLGGEVASNGPDALVPTQLAVSRSTQELFDPLTPFPAKGGESERMGRIVTARASDLRANRFAAWGVR